MGLEFQIVDKKNKTYFELGKGEWCHDIKQYKDRSALENVVRNEFDFNHKEYEDNLIDRICDFVEGSSVDDLVFVNDHELYELADPDDKYAYLSEEPKFPRYRDLLCLGSRYDDGHRLCIEYKDGELG